MVHVIDDKNLFILDKQYYGCWWSGDTKSHGINSNGLAFLSMIWWFQLQKCSELLPVTY